MQPSVHLRLSGLLSHTRPAARVVCNMYPNPRNRGYEADQYEKENEEKMGVLHNRISNLKNVRAYAP